MAREWGIYDLLTLLLQTSEDGFYIALALFIAYNTYMFMEFIECGQSARACWNNHRMQRITSASAWLLAFLTVILKTLGFSETVFEVTRKDKSTSDGDSNTDEPEPGRFTFDESTVFIPVTALAMLSVIAIAVGAWRVVLVTTEGLPGGPGISEFISCGWLVLCFMPLLRGLVGSGRYGIPWSIKMKACLLVAIFLLFCKRN